MNLSKTVMISVVRRRCREQTFGRYSPVAFAENAKSRCAGLSTPLRKNAVVEKAAWKEGPLIYCKNRQQEPGATPPRFVSC
jgi:hypothetical protein